MSRILVSMLALAAIFSFQNCSPYVPGSAATFSGLSTDSSSEPGTDQADPTAPTPAPNVPDIANWPAEHLNFFGASRCANSGIDFCDGFEGETLDPAWILRGASGVSLLRTTNAARGNGVVHIKRTGSGTAGLQMKSFFPVTNNSYYGRAFFRFITLPESPLPYLHYSFVTAAGTGNKTEIRIGGELQKGKNSLHVGSDGGPTGDWVTKTRDPANAVRSIPTNEWMCLEWQHDGQSNETRFFWNEFEHSSLTTTVTKHGGNKVPLELPVFDRVFVGWTSYQSSTLTYEMEIDEVAFHHERIGCVR